MPQSSRGEDSRIALENVRFGVTEARTRIVLDLARAPTYSMSLIGSGKPRLAIDLPRLSFSLERVAEWHPEHNRGIGIGSGLVERFRFAHHDRDVSRIVLDLAERAVIKDHFLLEPSQSFPHYRLVVDLTAASQRRFAEAVEAGGVTGRPGALEEAGDGPAVEQSRLIVVDAGHGGRDPGAIGPAGTKEKDIVLTFSKELAGILRDRGYEVRLTRTDDRFIELGQRVEIARRAGAAIFLSIHANALNDPSVSGSAVYTLSRKGVDRSKRLARQSTGSSPLGDLNLEDEPDIVGDVLVDLMTRYTNNRSSLLAQSLLQELQHANRLLRRPHRRENFAVLLAPDVAAVLVETAFISNAADERRLNSAGWRRKVARALANGVDQHFQTYAGL
jgi:N-acetylmuramoyl-L-alanine amidase